MDYSASLRKIERVMNGQPPEENIVVLYDAESANKYQPQPNDFIIMVDYGEESNEQLKSN